jgi:cyclopropane fatty-acyl-phospholipid synthase-like methyltransferase
MASRRLLFKMFYRLGFVPWDGHPLATSLQELIAGDGALAPGTALDLGCGTGDSSIYLAEHGWQVTGVDFVAKAVHKARTKAEANKVTATFTRADVTRLSSEGVGSNFGLIIDNGCLHGMSPEDRDAYARDARLLLVEFVTGASYGVPGIDPDEVKQRFAADWMLLSSGDEPALDHNGRNPARHYLFARAA